MKYDNLVSMPLYSQYQVYTT